MDPISTSIEAYKLGGIALALLVLCAFGIWCVWKANTKREQVMGARLDGDAKACREREEMLNKRLRVVEDQNRDDLKSLLHEVIQSNHRIGDALCISARAFEKLSESPSGEHYAIRRPADH